MWNEGERIKLKRPSPRSCAMLFCTMLEVSTCSAASTSPCDLGHYICVGCPSRWSPPGWFVGWLSKMPQAPPPMPFRLGACPRHLCKLFIRYPISYFPFPISNHQHSKSVRVLNNAKTLSCHRARGEWPAKASPASDFL